MIEVLTNEFVQSLVSNFLASGAVAYGAYRLIDHRLNLRRDREARAEVSVDILQSIKGELEENAARAAVLKGLVAEEAVPYPLFDLNGWTLLSQASVFTTLDARIVDSLIAVYNRLRTANELYSHYNDLMYGSTAVLAVTAIETMEAEKKRVESEKFNAHRTIVGERLVDRVEELRPLLDDTIKKLVDELIVQSPSGWYG
jgi:hypothetical protein